MSDFFTAIGALTTFGAILFALFAVIFRFIEERWPFQSEEKSEAIDPVARDIWREMVAVVEADLIENPNDWVSDGYRLTNSKRGVAMWIANQDYGLSLKVGAATGDVPLSGADKRRLWGVVQARVAAAVVGRFRDAA